MRNQLLIALTPHSVKLLHLRLRLEAARAAGEARILPAPADPRIGTGSPCSPKLIRPIL